MSENSLVLGWVAFDEVLICKDQKNVPRHDIIEEEKCLVWGCACNVKRCYFRYVHFIEGGFVVGVSH